MLELDGVRIRQGDFALAADWRVARGAWVAVIGPSGAGKSTLLHAIAGFLPLDAGRVRIAGADVTGLPPGRRPVSILFQDGNLFPHLSALENVALALAPAARSTTAQEDTARAALARVGLAGLEERRPGDLSGGQQGRVAVARTLVQDRPLVLLDEPFSALGPAMKAEMTALVRELAAERGQTVLMVTHDPADARAAPLAVLVAEGRAEPPVPSPELFADPPSALRDYLG